MNRRAMWNLKTLFASLLFTLSLAGCGAGTDAPAEKPPLEGAAIGGPFTLIDKGENEVRWSDFAGQYRVLYFGYTFCPDACPLDVQAMMAGFAQFEKDSPELAKRVQPIFITIDPERDTPDIVGQFAAAFHPRLLGLTGTSEQIDQTASAFAAAYARGEDTPGGYLMDHSRIVYLMGPQGEPIAMLPVDQGPSAVAQELAKWVR